MDAIDSHPGIWDAPSRMTSQEIAPGLLIAMPQLADPNFERAVVLMVRHSDEGSFGIITNRPSEVSVMEVFASLDVAWKGHPDAVVWSGGPVEPNTGFLLHEPSELVSNHEALEIGRELVLSTRGEALQALAAAPPPDLRFLMGYAGWGPHQLEDELAQGAWLLARATRQLVFETEPGKMWEAALTSIGIEPASLVPGPGIH